MNAWKIFDHTRTGGFMSLVTTTPNYNGANNNSKAWNMNGNGYGTGNNDDQLWNTP